MLSLRTVLLLALCLTSSAAIAQDGQPATGATTTFQIELSPGSNLVALPLLPDSVRMGAVLAGVLPNLTFVQDDVGRYFIPGQGIDGIGTWAWNEAYKIEVSALTSFFIEGAAILPEASPLLIDGEVGNWVPYFRRGPMAVEEAFASIAAALSRVEAADGRFYYPGDESSTLDSLRTGQGYKVWVSQPATLTYPPNPAPPGEEDTTPPSAPTGLTASVGSGRVTLGWNDNTEGDLAGLPYTVKRSGTAGGPYAPIASPDQSAYTDGTVANGTTYYYVVTATDGSGNESAPSVEKAATPQASTGLFALPASPTPTATDEAIGMRLQFNDDPKVMNQDPITAYDANTTQGERLWIGIGGTGYTQGHRLPAIEVDGAGGIQAKYVTTTGSLADLPPLGTEVGAGAYPNAYFFQHEGTNIGANVQYDDGSTAVHLLVMDGSNAVPNYSFRFVEEANGDTRLDTVSIYGVPWANGAKNHSLTATENGMVVMHSHSSDYHTNFPNLMVNRDVADGGDADFFIPGNTSGQATLGFKLGAVGDTVYYVNAKTPALGAVVPVGADSARFETRVSNISTFWGSEFDASGGFGATVRYVGPALDNPGILIYSRSSKLDYHNGVSGSVIPVDNQSSIAYQYVNGETYRVTYPDLLVQRLDGLVVGPTSATPTWTTLLDLDAPAGWVNPHLWKAEITDRGSVWLMGQKTVTFPATNGSADDDAVAYYQYGPN